MALIAIRSIIIILLNNSQMLLEVAPFSNVSQKTATEPLTKALVSSTIPFSAMG